MMGASDRKSTRLNSSHLGISYAVFCLKKKKKHTTALAIWSFHMQTEATAIVLHDARPISIDSAVLALWVYKCLVFVVNVFFFLMIRRPPRSTLFSSTTLFR